MMRVFLIALATASTLWVQAGAVSAAPAVGAAAPAFVGQTLDGAPVDLTKLRGHVVVVNLWATWCTPCRAEMPMLEGYYRKHRAEGVRLVGLSADRHRDLGDVRRVMQAFSYPAAVLVDAKENGFGSPTALPVTYVVDRDGVIRAVFNGADRPLTETALDAAVSGLSPSSGRIGPPGENGAGPETGRGVIVSRGWSRAPPPGAPTAAGYFTIDNHGPQDDRLLGVSSPVAEQASVHRMSMANGVMSMRPEPGGLAVPSGASIRLEPGGLHLMLMGLKRFPPVGSSFPVTLEFEHAGKMTVELAVLALGAPPPGGAMGRDPVQKR